MAGTLFGIGLSTIFDADGNLARGALLYVYQANTSTPVTVYSNFGLTAAHTWPVEADSAGRMPAIWLSDGSYRARITTSTGVEIFDEQSITAIGASTGASSGGSAASDTETVFQTGDILWAPVSGTRTGWVRCNGRTIGSGSSSATERANGDTQSLFEYLWNNFSDTLCPVGGGRGASATADFNANKAIGVLDMRSKTIFGLDTMGNSAAGVTGGSSTAADALGASTYTIVTANLPSTTLTHSLVVATSIDGSWATGDTTENIGADGSGTGALNNLSLTTMSLKSGTVTGTINLGGSGTDIDILAPCRAGTYYIKL